MRSAALMIAIVGGLSMGCGTAVVPQMPPPDHPVPPSEPRAEVSANIDLKPARDCEEAFDLALYQDRAIELIAWDERMGACNERHVEIRYLSRKISRKQVIDKARDNAVRVTEEPGKESNDVATQ